MDCTDGEWMKRGTLALTLVLVSAASIMIIWYQIRHGGDAGDFTIQVVPESARESAPGQRCVLLVTVGEDGSNEGRPVRISAFADGATVVVEHEVIVPGEVAEVSVIPEAAMTNQNITVTIVGRRGRERKTTATIPVVEADNQEPELAPQIRDRFSSWLEANYPNLNITSRTAWSGTVVTPRWLVVTHHLYFSEEWEMHVYWHVMIEPYNWARIDLRRRFEEISPSHAFEISSLTSSDDPFPIEPPEEVWR